jgi:hypothetical protein
MKKYRVFVDQSGKVENTELKTVVAYSNGTSKSIVISGADKRRLQRVFRSISKPHVFVYKVFSCLIFLLLKEEMKSIDEVVIDREYTGREDLIIKYLVEFMRRGGDDLNPDCISFEEIGKKNRAHGRAIATFRGNLKPDIIVTSDKLIKWLL